MPAGVKDVFGKLWSEVCQVHLYWSTFTQLYSKERIFLLNQFGPLFFSQIRYLLITNITLRLCQLTDPAKQGRFGNQSIERLILAVEAHSPAVAKSLHLKKRYAELSQRCVGFRKLRNRTIAHKEWAKPSSAPLPATTCDDVEQALKSIRDLMNAIEDHFTERTSQYEGFASNPGDAGFLLDRLQDLANRLDKDRESLGLPPYPRPTDCA
jgi:hypothetical protein